MEPGGTLKESRSSESAQEEAELAAAAICASHHVPAVQDVQDGAEQLDAGLVVGLDGVVVQLAAQLVGDQWQQDVPAVCGTERPSQAPPPPRQTRRLQLKVVLGVPPGCLKSSLSTILHMQPSFWRTSCVSGMLSMNLDRRTLRSHNSHVTARRQG